VEPAPRTEADSWCALSAGCRSSATRFGGRVRHQPWQARRVGGTIGSMDRGVIARGRLQGRHIELDENIEAVDGDVEVTVRPIRATAALPTASRLLALIASLPVGTRTMDDIDHQLGDERAAWDPRE